MNRWQPQRYICTTKPFGWFPGFIVGWLKVFDYIVGSSAPAR
jgi:hypothetical protein